MRIGWIRITASLLLIAAPAGAALPEDGVQVCRELGSQLVYIAEAGQPFVYRLLHEKIDQAREALVNAEAALIKSPEDPDLILAVEDAKYYLEDWTMKSFEMTIIPVKIQRVFRGNPAAESFIAIRPGMKVQPGRTYVFWGENRWAMFGVNIHDEGWALDVQNAPNAVRLLDASATSGGGAIYGALELEHANDGKRATPLANTRIRLTAAGYTEDVATDSDGIFIASNVPPGAVTITPMLPQQFAVANRALLTAKVVGGQCTSVNLRAALNGRMRGRVVGRDGKPRPGLSLELIPSTRGSSAPLDERYKATTNERGEFEFTAIPPGSYLLGHQLIGPHIVMPGQILPPKTFYPGTPDGTKAIKIVVGHATNHDGLYFVVEDLKPLPGR